MNNPKSNIGGLVMIRNCLKGSVSLINEKVKVKCLVDGKEPLNVGYTPPIDLWTL